MKNLVFFLSAIFITTQLTAQNQERLSVHFFDVPENLESEFLEFNSNVNNILENSGYLGDRLGIMKNTISQN